MARIKERYDGRLALITGASSGLGKVFAEQYAALGADVVLVARRRDRLEVLAREIETAHGNKAHIIVQDLSVVDAHVPVMAVISSIGQPVDILVNNAGFSVPQTYASTEWTRQRDFIMTLVMAVSSLAHAVAPQMKAQGWGRIINVSSMVAFAPGGVGHTLYPAAKAYVLRFSQSLNEELREHGITSTAVCPGSTRTEFQLANGMQDVMASAPQRFVCEAEDVVAGSIRANASGKAVYVPGWHNKVAVALMRYLPDALTVPLIRAGSKKYRVEE